MRLALALGLFACSFEAEPNRSAPIFSQPEETLEDPVVKSRLPREHWSMRMPEVPHHPEKAPLPPTTLFRAIPIGPQIHGWLPDYYITGQAFGDYDGDGWLDLYLTDTLGPNRLYRNDRRGGFELVEDAGDVALESSFSGGALFADYDNDGDQDLLVLALGPTVLFQNRGGFFVDVTAEAGVGAPGKGETAAFGDYDGDGHLDLFIANWFCYELECRQSPSESRSHVYHNEGDGTFTEVSALLGLENLTGLGFVASWLDFDDDGDLDLYLVNDKGYPGEPGPNRPMNRNLLWRNDGSGCDGWCFTEISISTGSDARIDGMGLAVGDYDEDGDLDLYMSDTIHSVLYRNEGGLFVDVAEEEGVIGDETGWGTVFLDYDSDGDLDLYLAIGRVFGFENHNRVYENVGGRFEDVSLASGADDPTYSMGVAAADYDRDGGIDLVVGGWDTGYRLYRNRASGGNWLSVKLTGGGAINRDAVGARATAHLSDGRSLMREVTCGSSLGAGSSLLLHFGLGAAEIDTLDVRWPDGSLESYSSPGKNQEIEISYLR